MEKKLALKVIFWISVAGILFSGTLTYQELVKQSCILGGCSYMLGMPVCVYGLIMYIAVFVISSLGLKSKK